MCLIVASESGVIPNETTLTYAYSVNPHAWGLMFHDGNGIQVSKGYRTVAMLKAVERANGYPYVLHFRYATHGTKGLDNAHPFKVRTGLYVAHNGVIPVKITDKAKSDTYHFARELERILELE